MSKVRVSVRQSSLTRSDYRLSNRGLIGNNRSSRLSVRIRNVGGFTTIDRKGSSFSYSYNVLGIVVVVLLICAVASSFGSGEPKTLYSLLMHLENTPSIPLDWLTSWKAGIALGDDWGIFDVPNGHGDLLVCVAGSLCNFGLQPCRSIVVDLLT